MQKAIDKDVSSLNDIQSAYEISANRTEKSLTLFGPLLDEVKQSIDEKWNIGLKK